MTGFAPAHEQLLASVPLPEGADIVEEVMYHEHAGTRLESVVVRDRSRPGPAPTVVIVHDWTGLREYPRVRAHMLARLGYTAVAIDLYGAGVRFADDDMEGASGEAGRYYGDTELFRGRVRAGFDAALERPEVDADQVVVAGYCFGGSATLELARTGAPARGFASFHGILTSYEPAQSDRIVAPLLVLTGGSDPIVPDSAITAFQDELRANDDLDWQLTVYSGAPHAFTLPGPNYRETADRRSWHAFLGFLGETLE
ncbi:dienelactone hydrolase family protein [Labedella endophytica]|uniref:Dienelactone hydrolase family protein n=1 Tax=Labedella endophytica TaxID=1523160 RepID=A0A433JMW8_9MICO|nr:dienelactone hydrolase family protein [Labedella endophytica]RUQ96926.1 dienelactone hydrolase family protein [Labedella endophytica]